MKLDFNYLSIMFMLFYITALLLEFKGSTFASVVSFVTSVVFLTGATYEIFKYLKGTK